VRLSVPHTSSFGGARPNAPTSRAFLAPVRSVLNAAGGSVGPSGPPAPLQWGSWLVGLNFYTGAVMFSTQSVDPAAPPPGPQAAGCAATAPAPSTALTYGLVALPTVLVVLRPPFTLQAVDAGNGAALGAPVNLTSPLTACQGARATLRTTSFWSIPPGPQAASGEYASSISGEL
jgi:hypothetical protein